MKSGPDKKPRRQIAWLSIYVLAMLLLVPNPIMVRYITTNMDDSIYLALRYMMTSALLLPFFIYSFKKHKTILKKNWSRLTIFAFIFTVGAFLYTYIIKNTSASIVTILSLLIPLAFATISTYIFKDTITRRGFIGLLLSVTGALTILVLPNIAQLSSSFDAGITLTTAIAALAFIIVDASFLVYARYENQTNKIPMAILLPSLFFATGLVYTFSALVKFDFSLNRITGEIASVSPVVFLLIAYLALVVSALVKLLRTKSYEHIGTTAAATIDYLPYPLALIMAAFILGESISPYVATGAVFIIAGIVLFKKKHHSPRR